MKVYRTAVREISGGSPMDDKERYAHIKWYVM